MRNSSQRLKCTLIVSLSLLTCIASLGFTPEPTLSQSSPPRPPVGRPGRQAQGGSRGGCPTVTIPLTALVPPTEGKTLAQRPTFWFYIPYTQGTAPAEFTLRDSEGNLIGKQLSVSLPVVPGVVGVRLPATVALEPGKRYRWFFNLYCTGREQPPISIEGSVERMGTSIVQPSTPQDPQQALARYIAAGVWLDALTTLAELRLTNPPNATLLQQWKDILNQLEFKQNELNQITASPLSR